MTRRLLPLIAFLIFSCSQKSDSVQDKRETVELDTIEVASTVIDSIPEKVDSLPDTNTVRVCGCQGQIPKIPRSRPKSYPLDSLKVLSKEQKLAIKSLYLPHFDTIPEEYGELENVEFLHVGYIDWREVNGLDLFPKLKGVRFWGKTVDLSDNPKWLQNIEVIEAEKSRLIGLKSFKSLPKLKEIRFAFSTFDVFPSNFESMQCLQKCSFGAYLGRDSIDLNRIDLSKMPCLEYGEFHSWHKNFKGLPKGMDGVKTVKVLHGNLTEEEKQRLKNHRQGGAKQSNKGENPSHGSLRLNLDSLHFISEREYLDDTLNHPLRAFSLSYPEWETISCIIAINEDSYWNKAMIGLIEKSGTLRINYKGKTIRLNPDKKVPFQKGEWRNTFRNDSLVVNLLIDLDEKKVMNSLTGNGKLQLVNQGQVYKETCFFVAQLK